MSDEIEPFHAIAIGQLALAVLPMLRVYCLLAFHISALSGNYNVSMYIWAKFPGFNPC